MPMKLLRNTSKPIFSIMKSRLDFLYNERALRHQAYKYRNNAMKVNTLGIGLLFIVIPAYSAVFWVDPASGDKANNGSVVSPWRTLQEVFEEGEIQSLKYKDKPAVPGSEMTVKNSGAPVKGGDTLLLKSGYHGKIFASEFYNEQYITLMAATGETPTFESIELRSASKWHLIGLTASPSHAPAFEKQTLFSFSSHKHTGPSFSCIIEKCRGFSVADVSNWTADDWNNKSCNGISLSGNNMVARSNHLKNVNFAYSATGDSCLMEYNVVENFSGDGIRGLGDFSTYQYNTVKNCYNVNENHDDGFQSWSEGEDGPGSGVVRSVVLRGNTIINYEDPNQPFKGTLQGIGCFDGKFEDWVVENNVIMVDHWHGLSLYGAINCRVVNNTVVDLNEQEPGPPWIKITEHKNGAPSVGCIVRNNLTTQLACSDNGVTLDHNIIMGNYADYFVDHASGDLRLNEGCEAINAGNPENAPVTDRNGFSRSDGIVDVGAFEYGSPLPALRHIRRETPAPFKIPMYSFDIRGRKIHPSIGLNANDLGPGLYIIQSGHPDPNNSQKQIWRHR